MEWSDFAEARVSFNRSLQALRRTIALSGDVLSQVVLAAIGRFETADRHTVKGPLLWGLFSR